MPLTFAKATHTGLVRGSNEDSYYARPPVFVVADGMGGAQAGEVASAMAARAFEHFLPQSDLPAQELAGMISSVNKSIYQYATGDSGHEGMGTTITAATIWGDSVAVAHVGDSRAWLFRDGSLSRLTEDHSLVAEMVREGQITEAEAAGHPQRSIITRALGVEPEIEVDTNNVRWQPGDVFLLASDGLYSMVAEEEIARIMAQGRDLRETAGALIETANGQGGGDNITVVLFSPDGSLTGEVSGEGKTETSGADPSSGAAALGADDPKEAKPRRRGPIRLLRAWFTSTPGIFITLFVLLAVAAGGAWFGTRYVYFVGLNDGKVTIYQGVPYDLGPLPLYSFYRSSEVDFNKLEDFEQERVNAQNLQSKSGAERMLDNFVVEDRRRREEEQRLRKEEEERGLKMPTVPVGGAP